MSVQTFAVIDPYDSKAPFNHEGSLLPCLRNPDPEANDPRETLILAIEQGLSALGESVAQVIFYNIDKKYSLKREDIPKKPDRFAEALGAIFGSGAITIEKLIIQSVCAATGLNPSNLDPQTLPHCIKQAEKILKTWKKAGKQG